MEEFLKLKFIWILEKIILEHIFSDFVFFAVLNFVKLAMDLKEHEI